MQLLTILLCFSLLAGSSPAPQRHADKGRPSLVIRGGFLFDSEAGRRRPLGQLWIGDGRVLAEKGLDDPIPEGTALVEAEGMTVLPGLFDLHCHLAVDGGPMNAPLPSRPRLNLASQLACGVTSVVDLHAGDGIFDLREESHDDPGLARLFVAGAAFTTPGGHGTQFGIPANTVTTPAEVQERFDRLLAHRPDVIKGILEHGGWAGIPELPTLSADLLGALGGRARQAGLPFFCHIWSLEEARTAVQCGATALAHGVFLGEVDQALLDSMKRAGTAYIPTLAVVLGAGEAAGGAAPFTHPLTREALCTDLYQALTDPELPSNSGATWAGAFAKESRAGALTNLRRIFEAGIPVGLGTDAGNPLTPHGPAALHELELYVEAGLTPAQALQCGTLRSAQILGVGEEFGSLSPGKIADDVLVRRDPTAEIARIWEVEQVFKAGRPFDASAIHEANLALREPVQRLVAGESVGEEIDGFDDTDLYSDWGGEWQVLTDSVAGGKSTGNLESSAEGGEGTLTLHGKVLEGFRWGAWSGMTLDWSAGRRRLVDASAFTGLRLRVRGTPRPYTLAVHRAAVKDYNLFVVPLEVGEQWAQIEIPFDSLKQIGFGKSVSWSADDLLGLSIDARNNPFKGESVFGEFTLEVDSIALYR